MIIKLVAETDAERKRFGGNEIVEHYNVKEYFFAGNKLDEDGNSVDFHEWNGGFRYLLGTLQYFYELINDDRIRAYMRDTNADSPSVRGIKNMPMVKRGTGGKIQAVDISKLKLQAQEEEAEDVGDVIEMPIQFPEVQKMQQTPSIEDEFIDENGDPSVSLGAPQDVIDAVADNVASKLQNEVKQQIKNKQGLRIIP